MRPQLQFRRLAISKQPYKSLAALPLLSSATALVRSKEQQSQWWLGDSAQLAAVLRNRSANLVASNGRLSVGVAITGPGLLQLFRGLQDNTASKAISVGTATGNALNASYRFGRSVNTAVDSVVTRSTDAWSYIDSFNIELTAQGNSRSSLHATEVLLRFWHVPVRYY